jgi:hypothetical protein
MQFQNKNSNLQNPISKIDSNKNFILFLTGHSNDATCALQDLPKDIIKVICLISPLKFIFCSPFDQQGVLSWIRNLTMRTNNLLIDKGNIIRFSENVYLIDSSNAGSAAIQIEDRVQRIKSIEMLGNIMEGSLYSSGGHSPIIDLQKFKLCPTHFTIADHYCLRNYNQRDVEILGSNDKVTWNVVKDLEASLFVTDSINRCLIRDYDLKFQQEIRGYFRYFKFQYKVKRDGVISHYVSGIELYGHLI